MIKSSPTLAAAASLAMMSSLANAQTQQPGSFRAMIRICHPNSKGGLQRQRRPLPGAQSLGLRPLRPKVLVHSLLTKGQRKLHRHHAVLGSRMWA